MFLLPNAHSFMEKSFGPPNSCNVLWQYVILTRDLKSQSGSQEAASRQLRLSNREPGQRNLAVASPLRRPGCTRTKASSFFQAQVLSMN